MLPTHAKVSNEGCFTDIIKFEQKNYGTGHAVVIKNGELFIEYSSDAESSERLFYDLKKMEEIIFLMIALSK